MNICFVLPRFSRRPIGGYKIIYEYANRIANSGDKVYIMFLNDKILMEYCIPVFFKNFVAKIMTKIEPRWFQLDKTITKISGTKASDNILESMDICIATGAETVDVCKQLFQKSKKFYFIQDFETWVRNDKELFDTYQSGFKNIVVSSWLKEIVDVHSDKESTLIKNPIDLSIYKPIVSIQQRDRYAVGLLYHSGEHKGLKYSISALRVLKEKYPELKVYMFGTSTPDEEIPGLVKFIRDATEKETVELYNQISIFMCSTINEGYGLTAMEAMACGAAVASSDYEGIHEYGIENVNCLLSPLRDVDGMVRNVSKLIEDDNLRFTIAQQGVESLKAFDWEFAFEKFYTEIKSIEE